MRGNKKAAHDRGRLSGSKILPFEMDFSLTGIPILPVNRPQKFLRLDMTSRDQGTLSGCADPKLYRLTRREFILM